MTYLAKEDLVSVKRNLCYSIRQYRYVYICGYNINWQPTEMQCCHKRSMTVNQLLCCGPERPLFTATFKNIFEFQTHWYYVDLGALRCEWENRSTRTKYAMFFISIRARTIPLTAGNISRGFSLRDVFFCSTLIKHYNVAFYGLVYLIFGRCVSSLRIKEVDKRYFTIERVIMMYIFTYLDHLNNANIFTCQN